MGAVIAAGLISVAACSDDTTDDGAPTPPVVSGVSDGDITNETVTITFTAPEGETYTATLDGDNYESGTPVDAEGAHDLIVTAVRDSNGLEASTDINFEIDVTAPTAEAGLTRVDGVTYQVQFGEPVTGGADEAGGENPANYTLSGDCALAAGNPVSVTLDASLMVAELTIAEPGCVSADDVQVDVTGVVDRAGNAVASESAAAKYFGVGTHLAADLTTAQEVAAPMGVQERTGGTASLALTPAGLEYAIAVADLTGPITAAHVHNEAIGVNGGAVYDIGASFTDNTARGIVDTAMLTDADVRALLLGELYLNIHTDMNPTGEVRGQISADRAAFLTAALTPEQETGGTTGADAAGGTAALRLTEAGLIFELTVASLSGPITNAHIHRGAVGTSDGIEFDFMATFNGNTARGVWMPTDTTPLTPELMKALLLGELYFNVHTAANPAGEVRGQIIPAGGLALEAALDGAQEQPPVTTTARGSASVLLTEAGAVFDITATGLSGPITAAHFHLGATGENGDAVRTITELIGNTARGVWSVSDGDPLTPELIEQLVAGNIYINLHTDANPSGEIRGQVVVGTGDGLVASFTGAQENPPVPVAATGTGSFRLDGRSLTYDITADGLTGPITAAHIHTGAMGVNDGVLYDLSGTIDGNTISGSVTLMPPELQALFLGELYVNLHTAQNGTGEIRGQILLAGGTGFSASLTGDQERPSTGSAGAGTGSAVMTAAGLVQRVTVSGLAGTITVAHIHESPIGVNGDVLFALSFTDGTEHSLWDAITAQERDLVTAGGTYFNIHTTVNGGGEIRGQITRNTD